jgi:hypothetical protein
MSAREISKADLLRWVDDLVDLDAEATIIVGKLAAFADEECCGWAKVETLAKAARCSTRTAQYRLRLLIERGYIRDTGRTHRLKDSTRSVPIYLVGPLVDDAEIEADRAGSMGADAAPIPAHGCKTSGAMGAACCTPKEPRDPSESSAELSTGAREADFVRLEVAYPRAGLGFSDQGMARRAWRDLVGGGTSAEALVEAAARYAADPLLKRRDFGPVGLHRWLSEGRYRAWLPDVGGETARGLAGGEAAEAGTRAACVLPAELAAQLADVMAEAAPYLVKASWCEADRIIRAATSIARDRLIERIGRRRLAELGIKIQWGNDERHA